MFDIRFRAWAARKTDADGLADVILVDPERGDHPGIDSLFRRFAVEVFIVGLRVGASMVDDAVPMIRRCIERIKLQGRPAARWSAEGRPAEGRPAARWSAEGRPAEGRPE